MREICTSGSVGGLAGQPAGSTRLLLGIYFGRLTAGGGGLPVLDRTTGNQ
jgi:hypothetical protein